MKKEKEETINSEKTLLRGREVLNKTFWKEIPLLPTHNYYQESEQSEQSA